MSDLQLPEDEQFVLCHWAVQAVAEGMLISEDAATDLLRNANDAGRLAILGNSYFAGVQCDGRWLVVEGRAPADGGDPGVADPPRHGAPARGVVRVTVYRSA